MSEGGNQRGPAKAPEPERSQAPLWVVIIGLAVALYSRTMQDEGVATVAFCLGVVIAVIGMLYWFLRPKHGFR
jgi:hypothetical protein